MKYSEIPKMSIKTFSKRFTKKTARLRGLRGTYSYMRIAFETMVIQNNGRSLYKLYH